MHLSFYCFYFISTLTEYKSNLKCNDLYFEHFSYFIIDKIIILGLDEDSPEEWSTAALWGFSTLAHLECHETQTAPSL